MLAALPQTGSKQLVEGLKLSLLLAIIQQNFTYSFVVEIGFLFCFAWPLGS